MTGPEGTATIESPKDEYRGQLCLLRYLQGDAAEVPQPGHVCALFEWIRLSRWNYSYGKAADLCLFIRLLNHVHPFQVFGSSANVAEYIWIVGIVLLLLGGLLFVMGVTSIGLYYSREDKRKSEIEFINTEAYASSAASARSVQSTNINNIYLIE